MNIFAGILGGYIIGAMVGNLVGHLMPKDSPWRDIVGISVALLVTLLWFKIAGVPIRP
jgi:hypothetical protein